MRLDPSISFHGCLQCGWCMALNSRAADGGAAPTADPAAPRLMLEQVRRGGHAEVATEKEAGWHQAMAFTSSSILSLLLQPRQCPRPLLPRVAGGALILVVLLIVGSVFVLGLSLVLPSLFGPVPLAALHLPLAAWLVFSIYL